MHDVILCVVIVLLIIRFFAPNIIDWFYDNAPLQNHSSMGYATDAPPAVPKPRGGTSEDYNDYLQEAALDPSIKEQHSEWLDSLQINLQPRMYSIRDDCDTSEVKRWGLLKIDYGNTINENQNIQIPSGRECEEADGGSNGRFGGYSIGGSL
jgi:hypothetical protein